MYAATNTAPNADGRVVPRNKGKLIGNLRAVQLLLGEHVHHDEPGIYRCACCGTALFASDAKFDAACGWPSSFEPLDPANVREERDTSHGIERTEIICNICDAHLLSFA